MNTEQMLAMLRHAYQQLCDGVVGNGKYFADGLIAPVIRSLEANARARSEDREAPVRVMLKLQEFWGLTDDEMGQMCGTGSATDLAVSFTFPSIKLRMQLLMSIRARLSALFRGNRQAEQTWLRTPWHRLDGITPLAAMTKSDLTTLPRLEAIVRELAGA